MLSEFPPSRIYGFAETISISPPIAPALWCSYSPSLKCIPITAKSLPDLLRTRLNGETSWPEVGSNYLNKLSGFLNMSLGPTNPAIAL